ncbi:hypothetical protein BR93DRAFT_979400 [Coniochaeta sp. PMI_546]|nr:hypothetical protein BR93DRAFT_979400 [Coniochaeta sp. PMI_546]
MLSSATYEHRPTMHLYSSINSPSSSMMSTSVTSNDSIDTIIFSPPSLSPPSLVLKTIHLNTHIDPIDLRTTAICPSPARSRRSIIQSDGQDDSPESSSPSPGSQGHPSPVITSLPATPAPWTPTSPAPKLQRANSNPTLTTIPLSPQPLRRRQSSSPPPSKLQTVSIEPLRRQGSGTDLSPIDECRISECDGKRKLRLEREARELAQLQGQVFSDGSDDEMDEEKNHAHRSPAPRQDNDPSTVKVDSEIPKARKKEKSKDNKLHNCSKVAREKSYGRVFDDPFSAAAVLLVLPFCPPLSVYLTFRECGGLNRHRVRELGVVVLLTVLGWLPGIIYALVVYFRHLPRPVNPHEDQALHLSSRQRSGQCSDKLS